MFADGVIERASTVGLGPHILEIKPPFAAARTFRSAFANGVSMIRRWTGILPEIQLAARRRSPLPPS